MKALKESGIKLADLHMNDDVTSGIGILIAADHYDILVGSKMKWKGVKLYKTPGGYMLCGELPEQFWRKMHQLT